MLSLCRIPWPTLAIAASLTLLPAHPALSQEPTPQVASAFLPSAHWAVAAVRRLAELGLAGPDFGWGDGSLTRDAVGRVFQNAIGIAQMKHPELERLVRGYWMRFTQEFPSTAATLDHRAHRPLTEGWALAGYAGATGRLYPVRSLDNTRDNIVGPFPRPNLSAFAGGANLSLTAGSHLAATITSEHDEGSWTIREGYLLASWKNVGVWAGRRAPAFQTGESGGIVIDGSAAFTGGGVALTNPIRLPWVLRYIGAIRFETFLSRVDSNAAVKHPWVFASHASISPIPRLMFGVTQAFEFSGSGLPPFNWPNFKEMFFAHGIVTAGREFENGVASGEIRFRPPVPLVPLSLYIEWGTDDNHAAWVLFPGRVIGAQVPAVPGVPSLSLGLEHAYFSGPCTACGNCHCEYYATWYRHYAFKDGWTLDGTPMGHPLGGDGYEWLLYGTWDNPGNRFRFDAQSFRRYRGPYNIYSPAHEGHSIGGSLSTVYRATSQLDVVLTGAIEDAKAWRESSLSTGLRWLF